MSYRLRQALPSDTVTLRYLHCQTFGEGDRALKLSECEAAWLVLDKHATPVGFAFLKYVGHGTGYLARAGVLPEHRGKGLQRKLIRVRERKARRLGWTHMVSDTRVNTSEASMNSLIRCGYRAYQPESPWAMRDSVHWRKDLRS